MGPWLAETHPTVSADVPKIKQVSGDSATKAIGGVKPGDVDVPKVKGTANPSPSQSTTQAIIDQKLKEYGVSWDEFNRLRNTRITEMSQYEYDMMIDIRKSIPNQRNKLFFRRLFQLKMQIIILVIKDGVLVDSYQKRRCG